MFKVDINSENGLHARPAGIIAKIASSFDGEVKIKKGDKEVNAKSIMSIMSLGIQKGDSIVIDVIGEGKELIEEKLKEVFDSFGE